MNVQKKSVCYIYIYGDSVMIKNQAGKIMNLHRFQLHEGTNKIGKRSNHKYETVS